MSKDTYVRGFCKAASSRGVNPKELAKFVKNAFSLDELKKSISDAWNNLDPEYKPWVGSGVGLLGGAGLGALAGGLTGLGAGRGALAGAGIGGVGGALYGSNAATRQQKELQNVMNDSWREEVNSLQDNLDKSEKSLAEQVKAYEQKEIERRSKQESLNKMIEEIARINKQNRIKQLKEKMKNAPTFNFPNR